MDGARGPQASGVGLLYTQCPDCGTVFKVTADALRAAQGDVRCGICSTSFSALDYLSELPLLRPNEGEPAHDDTITVEETPGMEFIELSSPAESPAESTPAPDGSDAATDPALAAADGQAGDESADADVDTGAGAGAEADAGADIGAEADADADAEAEAALEFHGSAEDLERLFVEGSVELLGSDGAYVADFEQSLSEIAGADLSGIEVIEESPPQDEDSAGGAAHPGQVAAVLAFRRPGQDVGDVREQASEDDTSDPLSRTDEYPMLTLHAPPGPGHGDDGVPEGREEPLQILIPEELRRAAEDRDPHAEAFAAGDEREPTGGRRWPLVAGLFALLLVLTAQGIHFWRDDLARHSIVGPWLLRAYAAAGLGLSPPVDLAAFEIRQLGAANDPIQAGRLKVRASIVNNAPFAQPYPLLRLSLQDRFGTTVGVRNLEPAEYLPGGGAGAMLAPSRRADAEIVFVDPGRDAVGYELDVCLRDAVGIRCSAELAGQRP